MRAAAEVARALREVFAELFDNEILNSTFAVGRTVAEPGEVV